MQIPCERPKRSDRICCTIRRYGDENLFRADVDAGRVSMHYRQHPTTAFAFLRTSFGHRRLPSAGTCGPRLRNEQTDRKSTRLNSSHLGISYAVFCLKKKKLCPNLTTSPCTAGRLGAHFTISLLPFFFFFLMMGPPPTSTLFPYPPLSQ